MLTKVVDNPVCNQLVCQRVPPIRSGRTLLSYIVSVFTKEEKELHRLDYKRKQQESTASLA
ncbi:hypothetical protein YK48G_12470 [Lentilactobacillus fungorum]|uniref:Uncharacterized protein n=1 Tax=Lentilactobacillus fungorum TaxID=2201250 RepID=A0ABQ3VY36_9LACO|nr:hypothetical protein YK48G_12470 [Lentilactobacillus fungorum]